MARVWNNVTNLENLNNRTILQLLQNQNELLQEFAKQIEQIEGIANTAVGTANNALNIANSANAKSDNAVTTANAASSAASQAVQTANEAVQTANAAEDKVLEYEPQVDGAVNAANAAQTAANQAVQAANAAQAAATQAVSEVGSLSDTVEEHGTDISQLETQVQTAQNGVNQINARESGYGETLSLSGSNLSLMHGATALSTVVLPGGGTGTPTTYSSVEGVLTINYEVVGSSRPTPFTTTGFYTIYDIPSSEQKIIHAFGSLSGVALTGDYFIYPSLSGYSPVASAPCYGWLISSGDTGQTLIPYTLVWHSGRGLYNYAVSVSKIDGIDPSTGVFTNYELWMVVTVV